jgi:uncharacterized iron-regulated membrane protein
VKGGPLAASFDWHAALQKVHSAYPDAEIRSIGMPRAAGQLVRIRARQPDEWLPNGRTMLYIDPATGRVIDSRNPRTLPLATRVFNLVYPLHASTVGGILYKTGMTISGLTLTLLGTLAVFGFWRYQTRRAAPASESARPQVPVAQ